MGKGRAGFTSVEVETLVLKPGEGIVYLSTFARNVDPFPGYQRDSPLDYLRSNHE